MCVCVCVCVCVKRKRIDEGRDEWYNINEDIIPKLELVIHLKSVILIILEGKERLRGSTNRLFAK